MLNLKNNRFQIKTWSILCSNLNAIGSIWNAFVQVKTRIGSDRLICQIYRLTLFDMLREHKNFTQWTQARITRKVHAKAMNFIICSRLPCLLYHFCISSDMISLIDAIVTAPIKIKQHMLWHARCHCLFSFLVTRAFHVPLVNVCTCCLWSVHAVHGFR